jgi:translation initiation factor 5A
MSKNYETLGNLKPGSFIIIDGEPCKIVEISKTKTGKHGSAKANVVAISLFTGNKKTLVAPADSQVEVPIIDKRVGQIIADMGEQFQLMDMESFETFEVDKSSIEEDLRDKLKVGSEVEYWVVMGKRLIIRLR